MSSPGLSGAKSRPANHMKLQPGPTCIYGLQLDFGGRRARRTNWAAAGFHQTAARSAAAAEGTGEDTRKAEDERDFRHFGADPRLTSLAVNTARWLVAE